MRFPKTAGKSTGLAGANQSPLSVQVAPSAKVGGTFEAHVTPRIALGVDMISGFAKAEVFMEIDTSGTIDLGVQAVGGKIDIVGKGKEDPEDISKVEGCLGINAAITARAGAQGSVFPFFDETAAFDFFKKEFQLFQVSSPFLPSYLFIYLFIY
jgi:hypothetical protein